MELYLPVPYWNGNKWVPVNTNVPPIESIKDIAIYAGYVATDWLVGFNPDNMNRPKFKLREKVKVNIQGKQEEAYIRRIKKAGGKHQIETTELDLANKVYLHENILYDVDLISNFRLVTVNEADITGI